MNILKLKSIITLVLLIVLCNKNCDVALLTRDTTLSWQKRVNEVERISNYQFQNKQLLRHVLEHHSITRDSKFQELEFLGDQVISAVVALKTFDTNKRASVLQKDFESKTANEFLAIKSLELGLYAIVHHNPGDIKQSRNSIAANVFEALVGAMQLDFENHPDQISPAVTRFLLKTFNLPATSQSLIPPSSRLSENRAIDRADNRETAHHQAELRRDNDRVDAAIAGIVGMGIGAGVGALWNLFFPAPDYKQLYEECRTKKNIYKGLSIVFGCMLGWSYISPYVILTNEN